MRIVAMRDVDPLYLVETIREGLLILEPDLTVRFANRSFCTTFPVAEEQMVGRKLYELGNRQLNIPELSRLKTARFSHTVFRLLSHCCGPAEEGS